ncbi:MAG: CDP-glycerol glycerophosphotransferase family protein [Eubacterium sp.]|nr:CDP-glycerol glycerophosphotransferase family protein [Eubacterium sp.]
MKLSIIIPYSHELTYIRDCFTSLNEQTVRDFEVVFVSDHAATDDLAMIKQEPVEFPIRFIELTGERTGVAAARNEGIKNSKGEFIMFLDCDDFIEKTAVEEFLEAADDRDLVYARRRRTPYGRDGYYADRERILAEQAAMNTTEETDPDEQDSEGEESLFTEYDVNDPDDWIGVFTKIIVIDPAMTAISALGIIYRRSYLIENDILFDESYRCFPDLPFVTRAMCETDRVRRLTTFLYMKRKHSDPVKMPSLAQRTDDAVKHVEIMRAYRTAKEKDKLSGTYAALRLDGKFIRYYVTRISPFFLRGEKSDIPEVYSETQKTLGLISDEAKKKSKRYSRRIVNYSMNHPAEKIAKKVRMHSRRQTLVRIMKSRSQTKRFFYRKFYATGKIKEKTVMFESFFGRNYSDSPKYIFEYLSKTYPGQFKCVWVRADNKKLRLPYPSKQVKRFSFRYFYYLGKSKYFVFNVRPPKYFIKRDDSIFLETWHGTPLKKLGTDMDAVFMAGGTDIVAYKKNFTDNSKKWDYLIAQNAFSSETFRRCFEFGGTMLETGYPRNDIMHAEPSVMEEKIRETKSALGIPDGKKIILYAPTWRDDEWYGTGQYKFTLKLDLDKLRETLGDEYVVVLRTHYLIVDALELDRYTGFAFNGATFDDISLLYLISDILITDYSSVFFDYANLKRPMLFFCYDLDKYRDVLRGFYFDLEELLPGPLVFTTEEIIDTIRNLPSVMEEYKEKATGFYERFNGWEDGSASKKVVEEVFGLS